jgi:hypothetical protein
MDWVEAERSRQTLKTELQRLKRRAQKRPVALLLVTLALVAGFMWRRAHKTPLRRAVVMLRVTESDVVQEQSPLAKQNLGNYLESVSLGSKQLLEIVEANDLYPLRRIRGERYALGRMRSAMKVKVHGNYFAEIRGFDAGRRTARISIYFYDKDPNVAFTVAQDLADTLVENERERRDKANLQLVTIADAMVAKAEARVAGIHGQVSELSLKLEELRKDASKSSDAMAAEVELSRLDQLQKSSALALEEAQKQKRQVEIALAAEQANLGLDFRVVDVRPPAPLPERSFLEQTLWAIGAFLCLLPLCAIGIAAYDNRLHDIQDLVRIDMPVVGHVPGFPSDRKGSLGERSRRAKAVA